METDLTQYVQDKMLKEAKNYRWRMVLDSHKRALEIYFLISLELDQEQYVQDINRRVNNKKLIQFEDVVSFYDENHHRLLPENYLKAIPFNPEIGIEEGLVDAFLKQLNIIISGAYSQLREFLMDDGQKEFELHWNEINMQQTVETLKNTNRYSKNKLTFTNDKNQSLMEQFKEDKDVGVERI